MRSSLYAVNSASQTLTDQSITFGTIVRRFGCNCDLRGGNAVVRGQGYYQIETNLNVTATGTLTTITLYKDGVAIPGATTTRTTAVGSQYQFNIPAVIRQCCDCEGVITVVTTGTVTNAAIIVNKL